MAEPGLQKTAIPEVATSQVEVHPIEVGEAEAAELALAGGQGGAQVVEGAGQGLPGGLGPGFGGTAGEWLSHGPGLRLGPDPGSEDGRQGVELLAAGGEQQLLCLADQLEHGPVADLVEHQ